MLHIHIWKTSFGQYCSPKVGQNSSYRLVDDPLLPTEKVEILPIIYPYNISHPPKFIICSTFYPRTNHDVEMYHIITVVEFDWIL